MAGGSTCSSWALYSPELHQRGHSWHISSSWRAAPQGLLTAGAAAHPGRSVDRVEGPPGGWQCGQGQAAGSATSHHNAPQHNQVTDRDDKDTAGRHNVDKISCSSLSKTARLLSGIKRPRLCSPVGSRPHIHDAHKHIRSWRLGKGPPACSNSGNDEPASRPSTVMLK